MFFGNVYEIADWSAGFRGFVAAYRVICSCEKLRSAGLIEEFLRLVVDSDSALSFLGVVREAARMRIESC